MVSIAISAIDIKNYEALCSWCKEQKVELVVVGPEDPLANGIADALTAKGGYYVPDIYIYADWTGSGMCDLILLCRHQVLWAISCSCPNRGQQILCQGVHG